MSDGTAEYADIHDRRVMDLVPLVREPFLRYVESFVEDVKNAVALAGSLHEIGAEFEVKFAFYAFFESFYVAVQVVFGSFKRGC